MKGNKKIMIIVTILILLFLIICGYLFNKLGSMKIGKTLQISIENGEYQYIEKMLETEEKISNKLLLIEHSVLEQLIEYMKDNDVRIVSGIYKIPQTSSFEEIIGIFKFESID